MTFDVNSKNLEFACIKRHWYDTQFFRGLKILIEWKMVEKQKELENVFTRKKRFFPILFPFYWRQKLISISPQNHFLMFYFYTKFEQNYSFNFGRKIDFFRQRTKKGDNQKCQKKFFFKKFKNSFFAALISFIWNFFKYLFLLFVPCFQVVILSQTLRIECPVLFFHSDAIKIQTFISQKFQNMQKLQKLQKLQNNWKCKDIFFLIDWWNRYKRY